MRFGSSNSSRRDSPAPTITRSSSSNDASIPLDKRPSRVRRRSEPVIVTRRQFAITSRNGDCCNRDCARPHIRRCSPIGFPANNSYLDVANYDVAFWRSYWKRTGTQAILVNGYAGFAAFTSSDPDGRSPFAPNRDLFGEIAAAHATEYISSRAWIRSHHGPSAMPISLASPRCDGNRPGRCASIVRSAGPTHVPGLQGDQ